MSEGEVYSRINRCSAILRTIVLKGIIFYQRYISPFKPRVCRFYPTCSQYFYEAIYKYGVLKGSNMGIKRLLKCHPFHPGGYNPVE